MLFNQNLDSTGNLEQKKEGAKAGGKKIIKTNINYRGKGKPCVKIVNLKRLFQPPNNLLLQVAGEWWYVENRLLSRGYVPASFLRPYSP